MLGIVLVLGQGRSWTKNWYIKSGIGCKANNTNRHLLWASRGGATPTPSEHHTDMEMSPTICSLHHILIESYPEEAVICDIYDCASTRQSLESPRQQLWHSVQGFLGEANRGGKTYRPSQRPGTRTEREEKANRAPIFVSLCFLTAGSAWPAILLPWLRLPCRIGPYPQTVSPKPVFLSLDAFVTHFCHSHKTISTTAFWFTLVSWIWRRSHRSAFT